MYMYVWTHAISTNDAYMSKPAQLYTFLVILFFFMFFFFYRNQYILTNTNTVLILFVDFLSIDV